MILTVDLGSSVTKVAVWGPDGRVAHAGRPVGTTHPRPGRSEQDATEWWATVVSACSEVRDRAPEAYAAVDVVGCTGARQTLVLVDADGRPLGPAIGWSDRRAGGEARRLAEKTEGGGGAPAPSGIPLDAASVAAKLGWLRSNHPDLLAAASWVLTPRDLVTHRLTGVVATDPTMASRSGLYDLDGRLDPALAGEAAVLLPPQVPPDRVTGPLTRPAAAALGLAGGLPVVIGAGDRACEVLGSGAAEDRPMVSWGTTANVSVPLGHRPARAPAGVVLSRAADGGWLLEGGLSAAGSLVAWIGRLVGQPAETLAEWAAVSPPGAGGVVAVPWLEGARAPWWRDEATVGFVGLHAGHGPGDLARAAYEAVAWEVQRCLEVASDRRPSGPVPTGLALGGSGAEVEVWTEVLCGVTGLPAHSRRSGQAASAGAALLAARAVGIETDLDRLDPVVRRHRPDPEVVPAYRSLRPRSDRAVAALLPLGRPSGPEVRACG